MSTLILLGVLGACLGIVVWVSRRQGVAAERARSQEAAREVEQDMAQVQSERVSTNDVKNKLEKGTF